MTTTATSTAAISKRPDYHPRWTTLLEKKGDEIFKDCDSHRHRSWTCEKEIGQTGAPLLAEKYGKPVFAAVSNMSIAVERRDYLPLAATASCATSRRPVCSSRTTTIISPPARWLQVLARNVHSANMTSMVVTMGGQGAVYAKHTGECGVVPAKKVDVIDTTGAGDAFFAGTAIGLTYGKNLAQSCEIGSRLAASVICITENVCPRFPPAGIRAGCAGSGLNLHLQAQRSLGLCAYFLMLPFDSFDAFRGFYRKTC